MKIYVAGHNGMVGSACVRALKSKGYQKIITVSSKELDLRESEKVNNFIKSNSPDIIICAAAKVGGIMANYEKPYEFLIDNLKIQNNLITSSHNNNVNKFIFLGSSCIYPKFAKQPLKEEYLLSGALEPTNESYALAKISGIKLIQAINRQFSKKYVSLMPTNLYGQNDNFDLKTSHVLPALIRKFHEAKLSNSPFVNLWGTGNPMREFLHVDDLADAIIFSFENELENDLYNIGTGKDLSIKDLSLLIKNIVGYDGEIKWDISKPDGTPRKLLDTSRFEKMGWKASINLEDGIKSVYEWYKEQYK